MFQAYSEPVSLGVVGARSVCIVDELGTVVKICGLGTLLEDILLGVVVEIVGSQIHLVIAEVPGSVDTAHPG